MKLSSIAQVIVLTLCSLTACSSISDSPAPAKDTVAPVVFLNGFSELTLDVGSKYSELGAIATDATDGSVDVTTAGTVDINNVGSYTVIYDATDAAGNKSSVTRTVNVVDNIAPVITLEGAERIEHNLDDEYNDSGATATDNVDGTVAVTTSGEVTIDQVNAYIITYTATDAAGNSATATRMVNVADLAAPILILTGESILSLTQYSDYEEQGATALDNADGVILVEAPTGNLDLNTIGEYSLTYTVTDAAGNTSEAIRTIIVVE